MNLVINMNTNHLPVVSLRNSSSLMLVLHIHNSQIIMISSTHHYHLIIRISNKHDLSPLHPTINPTIITEQDLVRNQPRLVTHTNSLMIVTKRGIIKIDLFPMVEMY